MSSRLALSPKLLGLLLALVSVHAFSPLVKEYHRTLKINPSLSDDPSYLYKWDTYTYSQKLDHYNFENSDVTFGQRYLVNLESWQKPDHPEGPGPIFFYAGNEGPIELFANNTGFMWEIAPKYKAAVVFAEHRYYGSSMPYGPATYENTENLRFLTAEQALADFAELLGDFKKQHNCSEAPVIAFGGSYGGMLAAWFRMKYPQVVAGAIASSAPILQFEGHVDPNKFNQIVTQDFQDANAACREGVSKSWAMMKDMGEKEDGRKTLTETLNLCPGSLNSVEDVTSSLYAWMLDVYAYLAMADYPYPATFLGDMPAYPVNASCEPFKSGDDDLQTLRNINHVMSIYYGAPSPCYNISGGGPSTLADLGGWDYQSCTEMVMPMGTDGKADMFWEAPWNLTAAMDRCVSTYGIVPRPDWIMTYFGGDNMLGFSNIFFSNGNLDPWYGGGVLGEMKNSPTIETFMIQGGAHHLDLRASDPLDPATVIECRKRQQQAITRWIKEHKYGPQEESSGLSRAWVAVISCAATALLLLLAFICFLRHQNRKRSQEHYVPAEIVGYEPVNA